MKGLEEVDHRLESQLYLMAFLCSEFCSTATAVFIFLNHSQYLWASQIYKQEGVDSE